MRDTILWIQLIAALILMAIITPKLFIEGVQGVIAGNWEPWNQHILRILEL